ncbi:MAG: YaeQ family protein, partial [Candidatus Eisenbacteria bacterium]
REGLAFSKGLAAPDEPALEVRDLTGRLLEWIEVGAPDAARLHRASKAARRVAVYTHQGAERYWASLAGDRIHNSGALELYAIDRALLTAFVARLERRMSFELSVADGVLYLTIGGDVISGGVTSHRLVAPGGA